MNENLENDKTIPGELVDERSDEYREDSEEGWPDEPSVVLLAIYEGERVVAEGVSFRDGATIVSHRTHAGEKTTFRSLTDAVNAYSAVTGESSYQVITTAVRFGRGTSDG